jgi:hypothetical protein
MRRIEKNIEPREWTEYRLTQDNPPYESKLELRESLLKEQGYICAYCMRRIPVKDDNSKDGAIKSSNTVFNAEMEKLLNLNHPLLKKNRHQTLQGVIKSLNKKPSWTKHEIQKYLINWENKDRDGKFKPYCAIVIWYLNRKLK